MKSRLAVVSLFVCLGFLVGRASAETWQDLLSRADSLAAAGSADSADAALEAALSSALTQYERSDTTVEFSTFEGGATRRHYFPSYAYAESVFAMCLRIKERIVGSASPGYATILSDLGRLHRQQGRYYEAESLFVQALSIREKALGPDHPDVAASLNSLGNLWWDQGRLSGAESLYVRALSIRERALGPNHLDVAWSLNNLAGLWNDQGRYSEAEPLFVRAVAIREKVLGPDDLDVAWGLNSLAGLYQKQGRYSEVEPLYERAVAIREKALGPDHPYVATSLGSLAVHYWEQGKYSEAEPLFERALAIREKVLGPNHPSVATILNNLGTMYWDQGRDSEVGPLFERALAIWEKALGPDHRSVAVSLNNLASLRWDQGRYSEAERLEKRALAIWEKALGSDHRDVAFGLSNLATHHFDQGQYSEAEPLCKRALAIWEKALGPDHPDVAFGLSNLAELYREQGEYSEAGPLYERALAIFERALGLDHPNVALCLESFCDLHRRRGERANAIDLARRACKIRHKNLVENSIGLSEKDALTFSQLLRASLSKYLSCCLDLGLTNPATALEAADLVVSCKGQVSDGILERQKSIVGGADSTTLSLAESLRYARFQLAKLFVEGSGEDVSACKSEVDSLDRFSEQLEVELSRRSASFRAYEAYGDVNADRITSLLPRNSALAEYVRYAYYDLEPKRDIPHYLVVVIATDGEPQVVDLGDASQMDSVIGTYRSHMLNVATSGRPPTFVDEQEYRRCAQDLYGKIWQPIEEYVSGRDLIFIAPDGALNMVSFAALIDKDGNYLIEGYPIHYLSAGRDLVRLSGEPTPGTGLLALGAPDYNASASSRLQAPVTQETTITELAYIRTRNVRSGCGRLNDLSLPPLPGTRREVELISSEWKKASQEPASIYFGSDASEERFKKEAHGKRVIHLATHGYFLEGACQPEVHEGSLERGGSFGRDAGYVGENPLLLSGLFFAGANLHGEGADRLGFEDGILTAYEVSGMRLEGTELVVLSACETGLGRVEEGEGVYGLRRAFQMAGARTVVSALWPVSDEATVEMMSGFYERRSESIPETIRRIQLEKIRDLRRHGKVDHPYTWAGFIALGDWR